LSTLKHSAGSGVFQATRSTPEGIDMAAILCSMMICATVAMTMLAAAVVSVNEADAARVRHDPRPH
jgi:hypothetical protein